VLFYEVATDLQGLSGYVKELPDAGTIEEYHCRFFTRHHHGYLNTHEAVSNEKSNIQSDHRTTGWQVGAVKDTGAWRSIRSARGEMAQQEAMPNARH